MQGENMPVEICMLCVTVLIKHSLGLSSLSYKRVVLEWFYLLFSVKD